MAAEGPTLCCALPFRSCRCCGCAAVLCRPHWLPHPLSLSVRHVPCRSPKKCNCKKSKCLKLYCDCFANGGYCGPACSCMNCANKVENRCAGAGHGSCGCFGGWLMSGYSFHSSNLRVSIIAAEPPLSACLAACGSACPLTHPCRLSPVRLCLQRYGAGSARGDQAAQPQRLCAEGWFSFAAAARSALVLQLLPGVLTKIKECRIAAC